MLQLHGYTEVSTIVSRGGSNGAKTPHFHGFSCQPAFFVVPSACGIGKEKHYILVLICLLRKGRRQIPDETFRLDEVP